MSRLCRLKTKTHGEDGQLAYEEITKLREQAAAQAAEIAQLKEQVKFVQSESFRTQAVSAQTFPTSAGDGDENTGNPNMYHESRNCLECLNREVDAQTEKIQAQAAVIEKLLEALTKIATARIGKPERWAHALFSDEKIAVEALATPSDSTQILAEVRRAERKRCAKVCESHPDPEYTAVHLECARRILEME